MRDLDGINVTRVISISIEGNIPYIYQRLFTQYLNYSEPTLTDVMCAVGEEGFTVLCSSSLDGTRVPVNYNCSYDGAASEDCNALHQFRHAN